MSIRVKTFASHPGSASTIDAYITEIVVEIVDDINEVVLATGSSQVDDHRGPKTVNAAREALQVLKNKVIQAEKELKAMGWMFS